MKKLIMAFLMNSLIFYSSSNHAETKIQGNKEIIWSSFLGVNAHFLWFTTEQYNKQIQALKNLGLEWVRIDLHWSAQEQTQNSFKFDQLDILANQLEKNNLHSLVYFVGSAPFISSAPSKVSNFDQYPPENIDVYADRIGSLAKRYPMIDAWQIWNEENIPAFWQPEEDPKAYATLLNSATRKLELVAPSKTIVIGGMAYYSQMPLRGGIMLDELGKLGLLNIGAIPDYHPYSNYPEGDNLENLDFIAFSQRLNSLLRSYKVKNIWTSEWGWSSYHGPVEAQPIIGEYGQANYTLKRLAITAALDVDKTFIFALSDLDNRATNRDQHYGLLDINGSPKPVYTALQRLLRITGPEIAPAPPPKLINAPKEVISIAWKKPDGTHLWMLFSQKKLNVTSPDIKNATLKNPLRNTQKSLMSMNNLMDIPVTNELQILEW